MQSAPRRCIRFTALLLAGATLVATARAQDPIWSQHGLAGDNGGNAEAGGRDVNGDGIGDVFSGGIQSGGKGVVQAYSGVDGALLYELLGDKVDDAFGVSLALFPDLDGDGRADFLVGAFRNDWKASDAGSAYLYSGKDHALIKALHGQLSDGHFGLRVSDAGDLDGDGAHDLAIGSPGDWTLGQNVGAVFIYSGHDFSLLRTIYGSGSHQPFFGNALDAGGDVDGDGVPDFIVGAPNDDDGGTGAGTAAVYSGSDGHLIWNLIGTAVNANLGSGVAIADDLDQDGRADFAVGAMFDDDPLANSGSVTIYSGIDAHVLIQFGGASAAANLGASMANVGDVNGDGIGDLLFGDNSDFHGTDSGSAWLYSGRSLRLLYRFDGTAAADNFGVGMSRAGDLNADHLPDLVVGAPYADPGGSDSGATYAFGGSELYLQGDPDVVKSGQTMTLSVRGGAPLGLCALFLTEFDGAPMVQELASATLDANGEFTLDVTVPPGFAGHSAVFQSFAIGAPAYGRGVLASGLEPVTFQ